MSWKSAVKRSIPPSMLNNLLLRFPSLYRTELVRYETNLLPKRVDELLNQLDQSMRLEGDIAECGSSRCGGTVYMANYLRSHGVRKTIYAFDSFEGFDRNELQSEKKLGWTDAPQNSFTSTSFDYVNKKLERLGVSDIVKPTKGYFQETLPKFEGKLCFAFIDCDLKDSLIYCGQTLWPHLVSGGRIVFDDYTSDEFKGARVGVDEFVKEYADVISEHGLRDDMYFACKK